MPIQGKDVPNHVLPCKHKEETWLGTRRFLVSRTIQTKKFEDYVHNNMVAKYVTVTNNSKCYKIPPCNNPAGPYSQSFFPRTVTEWNKLDDKVVLSGSVDSFRAQLKNQRQF